MNVVKGVPQGALLGPLIIVCTADIFPVVDNQIMGNEDDSTLIEVVEVHAVVRLSDALIVVYSFATTSQLSLIDVLSQINTFHPTNEFDDKKSEIIIS